MLFDNRKFFFSLDPNIFSCLQIQIYSQLWSATPEEIHMNKLVV